MWIIDQKALENFCQYFCWSKKIAYISIRKLYNEKNSLWKRDESSNYVMFIDETT